MSNVNHTGKRKNLTCLVFVFLCLIIMAFPLIVFPQPLEPYRNKTTLDIDSLIALSAAETNASKAIEWAEQAVNLADSMRIQLLKAKALRQSGISWKKWGNTTKSAERLNEAIAIFKLLNKKRLINQSKMDLGETYRAATGFDNAIDLFEDVLPYFRQTNDSVLLAETYNYMAATYFEMFYNHPDYSVVIDENVLSKSEMLNKLVDQPALKHLLHSSEAYLDSALKINSRLKKTELNISNENIRAALLNQVFEMDSAIAIYDRLIEMMKASGHITELSLVLTNKARIVGKYRLNKPEEAIEIGLEALEIAKKTKVNIYAFLAHEMLHDNYLALGNYKLAYEQLSEAMKLIEQFQFENLKLLINSQNYELQIHKRELEISQRQFQIKLLVISIAAVFVVFLVFAYILLKKNRKQNKLLSELSKKNNIISNQNQELAISNKEKDKLFSIIAHDLKSPFQSFLGFSELLMEDVHSFEAAELEQLAATMNKSAKQTMNLINELLDWARLKQDRLDFQPKPIILLDLIAEVIALLENNAKAKNITITASVPEGLSLKADKYMLSTIIRNLLSNAIKFTYPDGLIEVLSETTAHNVEIMVKDNGIGMKKEHLDKLFHIGETPVQKGTANEAGTGLGLILSKEFVEKHGGTIRVESEPNKGSCFVIKIPTYNA